MASHTSDPEPLFLTRKSAAKLISPPVSVSTVTRWQLHEGLPRHGTRGLALVKRDELEDFLSRKEASAS